MNAPAIELQPAGRVAQARSTADQARAGARLCAELHRQGRHAELLAESRRVLPLLAAPEFKALRRELLRCVTLSGSESGAFDRALDAAHELSRESRENQDDPDGGDDAESALTAAYALAVCLERMGDSWQAVRLLGKALESHDLDSPSRALMVAANGVCAICVGMAHRLRDTGAQTELQATLHNGRRHGERARRLLKTIPDAAYEVAVPGNLGEILLLLGDRDKALPLLQRALTLAQARGLRAHAWRVQTTLADWQLAAGEPARALDAAQSLLTAMGADAPQQTAIRAHDSAYRACRALGLHAQALAHLEAAERLDRARTTTQLRAQSQLFVTRTEAQRAREQAELAHADALRQRERADEMAVAAERDPLTGLGNRRHLHRRCAELIPQLMREGQPLSLALLDIDHFKHVNDRHGHAVGDRVLVALAQILRQHARR